MKKMFIGLIALSAISASAGELPLVVDKSINDIEISFTLLYEKPIWKPVRSLRSGYWGGWRKEVKCYVDDQKVLRAQLKFDFDYTISIRADGTIKPYSVKHRKKSFNLKLNSLCSEGIPQHIEVNGTVLQ